MKGMPEASANPRAWAHASSKVSPWSTVSAPREATASTLIRGVVTGMTMTARQPRRFAPRATPWAWLPAEAATTPRARASAGSPAILL